MESIDVTRLLPGGWQQQVLRAAAGAEFREYPRTPILSREADDITHVLRGRVRADKVREQLPWLYALYRAEFRDLSGAQCARDDRYGIVLNVQQGPEMRFECHVDSNPLTGLLFLTSHDDGGELVLGREDAKGTDEVDKDCTLIRPRAGQLVFFDGKTHPHYARPVEGTRVAAVMNFYTPSCPEETRPAELNRHLFGDR